MYNVGDQYEENDDDSLYHSLVVSNRFCKFTYKQQHWTISCVARCVQLA